MTELRASTTSEYDSLAEVYDEWILGDSAAKACEEFYLSFCEPYETPILELGIGTGRIGLLLAKSGKALIGIDSSKKMLERCSRKASDAGLSDRVQLFQRDLRDFNVTSEAELAIFPMRSIGHLLGTDYRRSVFESVHANLRPGGRFVFDHYVFDEQWARAHDRIPRLMYFGGAEGQSLAIWDTYVYSFDAKRMDCCITIEELDERGLVTARRHCPLSFSWIEPSEISTLAEETGFAVESLWGDFSRTPFSADSCEQIWVLKKL